VEAVRDTNAAGAGTTRFIILCAARTGSTMLRHLINSHRDAACHGEVAAGALRSLVGVEFGRKYPIARRLEEIRSADLVGFVRDFVLYPGDLQTVGFKIKYDELVLAEYEGLLQALIDDRSMHVVHLRRTNLLKRFLSQITALRSGVYFATDEAHVPPVAPFSLSPEECVENFELIRQRETKFATLFGGHPIYDITYEEFVSPGSDSLAALQRFLGLERQKLTSPTVKMNPDAARRLLENYDALHRHFRNTPYSQYFEPVHEAGAG
jgi:hypothetical protein